MNGNDYFVSDDDYYASISGGNSGGNGSSPSFLDYLNFGGRTATGVLGALNQRAAATAAPAKPANVGLIIGIGAAVLVVFLLIFSLGRK